MKYNLLFLLTLLSQICFSQNYIDGFIVTNSNDTIKCHILKNKKSKNDYASVILKDNTGNTKELFAKDIKGYFKDGFWYKSSNTQYFSGFIKKDDDSDQNEICRKNIIKIDLLSLTGSLAGSSELFNVWKFEYERSIRRRNSLVLQTSFGVYGGTTYRHGIRAQSELKKSVYSGFTIQGQYRYYLRNNRLIYPRGVYSGIHLKYAQLFGNYRHFINNELIKHQKTTVTYIGAGPVLGYQFMIFKRISLNTSVGVLYALHMQSSNPLPDNYYMFFTFTPDVMFGLGYAFGKK